MNNTTVQYTWREYEKLLEHLNSVGYEFVSFDRSPGDGNIFLRHDVDWSPEKAVKMARIEADHGITATYFFLLTSPLYNVHFSDNRDVIAEIEDLGHDVGLHFSTHQHWSAEPSGKELEARIEDELTALNVVAESVSPSISFHVPPEWVLDRKFASFSHTYEPTYFSDITYVADSSHRWRSQPPFPDELTETAQVLTHPGLWGTDDESFEERLATARDARFESVRSFLDNQFLGE